MARQSPTIIALGNFDGIHRGHRQVIDSILTPFDGVERDGVKTVVSFTPHPQEFFTKQHRLLLTPLAEKREYLNAIGVETLRLLPFDAKMAQLTPKEFVHSVLVEELQVQSVSVGQNFRFGHRRAGTTEDLKAIAAEYDIPVYVAPLYRSEGDRISSSAIRAALGKGDIATANRLLGRPYGLMGEVVKGQQIGRTIGFPTANLDLPPDKFLPRQGVYAVTVWIKNNDASPLSPSNADSSPEPIPAISGVMNLGTRPTVEGLKQTTEVHLLDWTGDLYGKTLTVELNDFLRPEQKFENLEQLKNQIEKDCNQARSLIHS